MIKNLSIENYKCFRENEEFVFSNLTLISGINGAGKSSVIQAMLILRQSWLNKFVDLHTQVKLDGDLVNVGETSSLRNSQGSSPIVRIALIEDQLEEVSFEIDTTSYKAIAPVIIKGNLDSLTGTSSLFKEDFVYLYADRIIPEKRYKRTEPSLTDSRLGDRQGSNTAFRLYQSIVNNELLPIPELVFAEDGNSVLNNVSAWINYILGGYSMRISASQESTDEVSIKYYVKNNAGIENEMSPENVAFGNSYILPIVLGVLTAERGSLIIIENPEAHLHPAAQTRMGVFLSRAAHQGVQIVIESHSEHLMNGIRLSVKKNELTSDEVEFYFIDLYKGSPRKTRIPVKDNGGLTRWPNGFFDEWENSLMEISK